jgi:hypothetical protein
MLLLQVHEHNNKSHPIVDAMVKKDLFFEAEISFHTVITANIANCLHDFPFFGYNNRARR